MILRLLALALLLALVLLADTAAAARPGGAFAPLDGAAGGHGRALRTWYWRPAWRPWVYRPVVWWG